MNVHHLELFYHVATHRGISRAVRHMPYGIQQPAVSSQMLQLEDALGVRLFERTPFRLTAAGEELYGYIAPFFNGLPDLAERLSSRAVARLRIGAAEMVLADYLPQILDRLRRQHPEFRLGLQSIGSSDLARAFSEGTIDLALSPLDRRPPPGLRRELLLKLPLALIVPKKARWSAADLGSEALRAQPLICLPSGERICWLFHEELKRRRLAWPVAIEASSLALLCRYVENGYGIGVSVAAPALADHPRLRALALPDFPPLELYAVWSGEADPLVRALLDEVHRYVREEWQA